MLVTLKRLIATDDEQDHIACDRLSAWSANRPVCDLDERSEPGAWSAEDTIGSDDITHTHGLLAVVVGECGRVVSRLVKRQRAIGLGSDVAV